MLPVNEARDRSKVYSSAVCTMKRININIHTQFLKEYKKLRGQSVGEG